MIFQVERTCFCFACVLLLPRGSAYMRIHLTTLLLLPILMYKSLLACLQPFKPL